jgi:dTMP kinase
LSAWATEELLPDLTILLDLPSEISRARLHGARSRYDRLEAEAVDFHDRVRAAYLELAEAEPARIVVIDAERSVDEIAAEVRDRVAPFL